MRFMGKVLIAAVAAGLFCSTLAAAESGFIGRLGYGLSSLKVEASGGGKSSDNGGAFDIYGGYRMQNGQFGLSYTNLKCDGCTANYLLASGAYVVEDLHNNIKPFLGVGVGMFHFKEDGFLDKNGVFGTANLGVNVEFDNFFVGTEFRQRIFGGVEKDVKFASGTVKAKAEPKQTYLLYVGYKF
ncbi:MAG: porin family protein [Campylobacteraceae bacterium]|jgi:hypothetical protein|nr:porin family protein [Campylobacteraceae bacterium]